MSRNTTQNPPEVPHATAPYENFELCPTLTSKVRCFRVRTYKEGIFSEVAHEHVPAPRLSQDRSLEVLRALVARFAEWPAVYVVRSHLNDRGRSPQTYPGFLHSTNYPEAGVLRHYVSSSNVTAWGVDAVVSPASFRSSAH
jgi:hypothetical protein